MTLEVSNYVAKGNDFRLKKTRSNYDLRQFGCTSRTANVWNSLPKGLSANTTNTLKN